jgi:hypothetical protein
MITILSALASLLSFHFRSRAPLAFLVDIIVGNIGCFFVIDNAPFAPRADPGGFAGQEDFEVVGRKMAVHGFRG